MRHNNYYQRSFLRTFEISRSANAAITLRWNLAVDVLAGKPSRRRRLPDEFPDNVREELIEIVDVLLARANLVLD